MDTSFEARLKFQIEKLNYRFHNLDYLQEALTYSIENNELNPDFLAKDGTNKRFSVVGDKVLKLVASEYVIRSSENCQADEGDWTIRRDELIQKVKQKEVGRSLFESPKKPEFARIKISDFQNGSFTRYDTIVKAIFGAIFMDSGGCSGTGMENCLKLFEKLWKLPITLNANGGRKTLKDLFLHPELEVKLFWIGEGLLNPKFLQNLLEVLKLDTFQNNHLLLEAIIHQSLYDPVRNNTPFFNKPKPDYQKLEFLGDAVLAVALAEYHWKHFPEFGSSDLAGTVSSLAEGCLQQIIYEKLGLQKFVKLRNAQNWDSYDDIIESIIGAIYIDSGSNNASKFILQHWSLIGQEKFKNLIDLQCKLNYKFKNEAILKQALTHPSYFPDPNESRLSKETLEKSHTMGKAIVKMIATEYAFQTAKRSARSGAIEAQRNYLCGSTVLENLSKYLDLSSYVQMSDTLRIGKTPLKKFEPFLLAILASVFQELKRNGENEEDKIREIFYSLWNSYLEKVPSRTLIQCFLPSPANANIQLRQEIFQNRISDEQLAIMRGFLEGIFGHTFNNITFLDQALTDRTCRSVCSNPSVGDSERFSLFGDSVVKYFFLVLNANYNVGTENDIPFDTTNVTGIGSLNMLRLYYLTSKGPLRLINDELEQTILYSVLGAVYLDFHSASEVKLAVKKWKCHMEAMYHMNCTEPDNISETKQTPHRMKDNEIPSNSTNLTKFRSNSNSKKTEVRANRITQVQEPDSGKRLNLECRIHESVQASGEASMHKQENHVSRRKPEGSRDDYVKGLGNKTKLGNAKSIPSESSTRLQELVHSKLQQLSACTKAPEMQDLLQDSFLLKIQYLSSLSVTDLAEYSESQLKSIFSLCSSTIEELENLKALQNKGPVSASSCHRSQPTRETNTPNVSRSTRETEYVPESSSSYVANGTHQMHSYGNSSSPKNIPTTVQQKIPHSSEYYTSYHPSTSSILEWGSDSIEKNKRERRRQCCEKLNRTTLSNNDKETSVLSAQQHHNTLCSSSYSRKSKKSVFPTTSTVEAQIINNKPEVLETSETNPKDKDEPTTFEITVGAIIWISLFWIFISYIQK